MAWLRAENIAFADEGNELRVTPRGPSRGLLVGVAWNVTLVFANDRLSDVVVQEGLTGPWRHGPRHTARAGPASRGRRSGWRQDDHRDRTRRLLLVSGVAITVALVDELPHAAVVWIRRLKHPRGPPSTLTGNLNLHVRVGSQVVKPRRRAIGAPVGGDHKVSVTVLCVRKAVRPGQARATTGTAQQQGWDANHAMPNAPIRAYVQLLVETEKVARDAHAHSLCAHARSSTRSETTRPSTPAQSAGR
ncbi:MAG: hypothetical protein QOG59_463 [Solirubrobacteraceae bacterium]|nr:hypothetical protein [Solirubrobacteraceae bacterium]